MVNKQKSIRPILVEFGLSKAQISQLPESITSEADFIDGIRQIVASLTDPQKKAIMEAAIVEAIEIFKNSILEQTDVELTEEQEEKIKEYTAPESETPDTETPDTETPDEETPELETPESETPDTETPETDTPETETPDEETPDEETPKEETEDEGGGDFGKSGGGGGQSGGGGSRQDPDDDDDPKPSGGGGTPPPTGGGTPPPSGQMPIHDDDFSIPDLPDECMEKYQGDFYKSKFSVSGYSRKEQFFSISADGFLFWGWTADQWIYAYRDLVVCNQPSKTGSLDKPNLFSIIKYKWENYKVRVAKKLDRAFIYLQYFKFLKFFSARDVRLDTNIIYPYKINALPSEFQKFPNYIDIFDPIYLTTPFIKNNSNTEWTIESLDKDKRGFFGQKGAKGEIIRNELLKKAKLINKDNQTDTYAALFVDNETEGVSKLFLTNGSILLRTNSNDEIFTEPNIDEKKYKFLFNNVGGIITEKSNLNWKNAIDWRDDEAFKSLEAFDILSLLGLARQLDMINKLLFEKKEFGIYTLNFQTADGEIIAFQPNLFYEALSFLYNYRESNTSLTNVLANIYYVENVNQLYINLNEEGSFNPLKNENTFVVVSPLIPRNQHFYSYRIIGASQNDWVKMNITPIRITPQPTTPEPEPEPSSEPLTKEQIESEIKGLKIALKYETDPNEKERIKAEIKALKTTLKFI